MPVVQTSWTQQAHLSKSVEVINGQRRWSRLFTGPEHGNEEEETGSGEDGEDSMNDEDVEFAEMWAGILA
ncbi:hypothetical protein V1523DRAFT_429616 [Lipomyces doorenjongii]